MRAIQARWRAPHGSTNRRRMGSVLIEIVFAIALFVGAAAFTLGAARGVFDTIDRESRRLEAVDLARSLLAELEAGLITIADLRSGPVGLVGSFRHSERQDDRSGNARWQVDLHTERSGFAGLSLVEITISEWSSTPDQERTGDRISVTIRQFMPLRETAADEYEQDELFEGLPATEPSADREARP